MISKHAPLTLPLLAAVTVVLSTDACAGDPAQKRLALLRTFAAEFVEITPGKGKFPGEFEMGTSGGNPSEQPAHPVALQTSFAIAKYEVPQDLYEAVMGTNPSRWKGARNSVEMMTWGEAVNFCEKVTALLHEAQLIAEEDVVRLPTEAEWEYCCRAGTKTAFSFGPSATKPGDADKQASLLDRYAWHTGNAAGNDPPVGALEPNPWGLYDMHGYLWEFTADHWHDNYDGAPRDGSAWRTAGEETPRYVIRGGSWKDRHERLRCAARAPISSTAKDDAVGFRCVKSRKTKSQ